MRLKANRLISGRRATRVAIESFEPRRLLAAVAWDGGGDGASWNDPLNWTGNNVPISDSDVTINVAANPTILLFSSPATIRSLDSSEALRISSSLIVGVGGATLRAATRVSGSAAISVAGNLTTNGVLTLGNVSDSSYGAIVIDGTANTTIGGTGSIAVADGTGGLIFNVSAPALTIGSGIEITGQALGIYDNGGGGTITNQGQLLPSGGNWQLGTNNARFVNDGVITLSAGSTVNAYNLVNNAGRTISSTGSTLTLYEDATSGPYSWDNNGTIALDGSTLDLRGEFTRLDIGTTTSVNNSVISVAGTLVNTALTLTLDNALGSIVLVNGGTIRGGTITRTGTNELIPSDGYLDGVTLNLPVRVIGYHNLFVRGGLTLNDVLTLGSLGDNTPGTLYFFSNDIAGAAANQTLGGSGSISVVGTTTSSITNGIFDPLAADGGVGGVLTIGSGIEIGGANLYMTSTAVYGSIVNNGQLLVPADARWVLGTGGTNVVNNNVFTIAAGAEVTSSNLINNPGRTIGVTGGTLRLIDDGLPGPDSWDNNGTIVANGGRIELGGEFVFADIGTITRSNGAVLAITGTLLNGATTLTLNNALGSVELAIGGRIRGGSIVRVGANELTVGTGGTLDGVTLNVPLIVDANASLVIENGFVLNDVLTLGGATDDSPGYLTFVGTTARTFAGSGSVLVVGASTSAVVNNLFDFEDGGVPKPLTIGSGIEIIGRNALIYSANGGTNLINDGQIGSTVAGGRIQVGLAASDALINHGTILAQNGGRTDVSNLIGNAATISPTAASKIVLNGFYTLDQPVTIGNDALLVLHGDWTKSATFDVGGMVVFDYAPGDPTPFATLQAQAVTGRNNGAWNGAGLRSARAAAAPSSLTVAVVQSTVIGASGGYFSDIYVDTTAVVARATLRGDSNIDATVNFDDLLALARNYGATTGRTSAQGDTDYNGAVNFDDLLALARNYGQSLAPPMPMTATPTATRRRSVASDVI